MKYVILIIAVLLLLSGCAPLSPHASECVTSDPYGFWGGLWHGLIIPFSWIVSWFNSNVTLFAYDNNGHWYISGFAIGSGALVTLLRTVASIFKSILK